MGEGVGGPSMSLDALLKQRLSGSQVVLVPPTHRHRSSSASRSRHLQKALLPQKLRPSHHTNETDS
ncbi:hypothetical protein, partial [Synechococcus sp. MIT S9508]|uniref:hypothetical protein n=1 Tax=Synechococcus sp. MIT S9508 TaxID=1801629 RepID=UPI001E4110BB